MHFYQLSHYEIIDIEKVVVRSRTQSSKVLEPSHTVKSMNNSRVLCIILVIMPEHQSDIFDIHSDDGNPFRANIKQARGRVILCNIHNDDGNPSRANIKQALRWVTCEI
nr:hypothetical protein [Tanacetum cinerariifolium]